MVSSTLRTTQAFLVTDEGVSGGGAPGTLFKLSCTPPPPRSEFVYTASTLCAVDWGEQEAAHLRGERVDKCLMGVRGARIRGKKTGHFFKWKISGMFFSENVLRTPGKFTQTASVYTYFACLTRALVIDRVSTTRDPMTDQCEFEEVMHHHLSLPSH